jgi:hypothetical protein
VLLVRTDLIELAELRATLYFVRRRLRAEASVGERLTSP